MFGLIEKEKDKIALPLTLHCHKSRAAAMRKRCAAWHDKKIIFENKLFKGEFFMRITFVIALLALSATSTALGQKHNARNDKEKIIQTIRQLDSKRIQAQIDADTAALNRIYADDFIGVGPSGTVRAKPQVISDFISGGLKFQSITTDDVQIRVYGNTAVQTGRSTMIGQDKNKVVPRDNRFTRVWAKLHGNWQLVANHYSLLISQQ